MKEIIKVSHLSKSFEDNPIIKDISFSVNEGEIFIQLINMSPFGINIKKGDKIAQGIISQYQTVSNEHQITTMRTGGHGSTK